MRVEYRHIVQITLWTTRVRQRPPIPGSTRHDLGTKHTVPSLHKLSCPDPLICPPAPRAPRRRQVEGWEPTARVVAFAKTTNLRLAQTQCSEDCFNRMRAEETAGRTKMVRHERLWSSIVRPRMLHTTHKFDEMPWRMEQPMRGQRFEVRFFQPSVNGVSDPEFHTIMAQRKTSWYSPAATQLPQVHLDLELCSYMKEHNLWHLSDKLWLCTLLTVPNMIVRHTTWPANVWCMPLDLYGGEAGLGWPLVEKYAAGAAGSSGAGLERYYEFSVSVKAFADLKFLVVHDPGEWRAQGVEYWSPLHQSLKYGKAMDDDHGRRRAHANPTEELSQQPVLFLPAVLVETRRSQPPRSSPEH